MESKFNLRQYNWSGDRDYQIAVVAFGDLQRIHDAKKRAELLAAVGEDSYWEAGQTERAPSNYIMGVHREMALNSQKAHLRQAIARIYPLAADQATKGLHQYVWYSMCSAHPGDIDPQCGPCHSGQWIDQNDLEWKADQQLYKDNPEAWMSKHNLSSPVGPTGGGNKHV